MRGGLCPIRVPRALSCRARDDGGDPFGVCAIRSCIAPISAAEPVAWGIDLAKSQDYTVAIAFDQEKRVCRFERWQAPWDATIQRLKAIVGTGAAALVDSTGVGDPVLEALQKDGGGRFEGFKFTAQSKQQLMEGLAVAIQQQQIRYPDGPIASELESFGYEYTRTGVRYAAAEGLYNNCVCALALAVRQHESRGTGCPDGGGCWGSEPTRRAAAHSGTITWIVGYGRSTSIISAASLPNERPQLGATSQSTEIRHQWLI